MEHIGVCFMTRFMAIIYIHSFKRLLKSRVRWWLLVCRIKAYCQSMCVSMSVCQWIIGGHRRTRHTTPQWGRKRKRGRGDRLSMRGLNHSELKQNQLRLVCMCVCVCYFPALQQEERKTQQTAEQNKQNTQGQKVHIYIKRQKKSHCWSQGTKEARTMGERLTKAAGRRKQPG